MGTPETIYFAISGLLNGISCTALAIFVLYKGPRKSSNRFYCFFALPVALFNFLYYFWAIAPSPEEALKVFVPLMNFVIAINPFFLHFAAALTETVRRRRKSLIVCYALSAFFLIANQQLWLYTKLVPQQRWGWWPVITPLCSLYHLVWFYHVGLGHVWLWKAFRASSGVRQQQLKWTFIGTFVGYGGGATNWFLWYGIPIPPVLNILITPFQVIIAYAILKHQLMDIRIVLRRTFVYSALIACITAVYLVMVLIMERWFQGFLGYRSVFATVFVAFLIAVFFNPLRNRIQAFVERALFKATTAELVTQREQLLAEVRKGEQMKAVGTLAAGLAHEIKNPLSSIKTFTEYLGTRYADPEFRVKFQKVVGGEVERINLIVQQLLEFAKPVPPKLMPLEVSTLLDETLEFLNNEFLQHHVEIHKWYEAQALILGDPQQLKQIFLNLFLNSLQAMNGAGRLEVHTARHGAELVVTITDNGTGITPKDLPHIFEPFYTTKPTGTGLGLAVAQGIVKEHGGRIEVESQPGQGTTMRFYLPVAV